jgi:hypothetical protein
MRQFASSGFRLWNLSLEAKIIYTFFCGLSLLAMFSSLLLYEDLVGPSLSGNHTARVRAYYASAEKEPPAPPNKPAAAGDGASASPDRGAGGGPAIALPDDAEATPAPAQRLTVTIPYRKLLEVTHFHLFTVPVFLLILTHLFLLTAMARRWKLFFIVAGWSTGALHVLAPWLVRYGGASAAAAFPVSGAGFLASSLVLCLYPLFPMWRRPPSRGRKKLAASATDNLPGSSPLSEDDESAE